MATPLSGEDKGFIADFTALSDETIDPDKEFAHGLPDNHDADVECGFTEWCMKVYKENLSTWKDKLLEEYWKHYFEPFNLDIFLSLPMNLRRNLRDHLRKNGM